MKCYLVYLSIIHTELEVGPLLEHLLERGEELHVLIGWQGPSADQAADKYSALGAQVTRGPAALSYGDPTTPSHLATAATVNQSRLSAKWNALKAVASIFTNMLRVRRYTFDLVLDDKPDAVIVSSDHCSGQLYNGLQRACRKLNIPVVAIPFSPIISIGVAERSRFYREGHNGIEPASYVTYSIFSKTLARLFPHWTRSNGKTRIFMRPPILLLCAWLMDLQDKDPWSNPSPRLSLYFAGTRHAKELLSSTGYPMEKVRLYGIPRLDKIVEKLRNHKYQSDVFALLNIEDGEQFILWNMEPSWEHAYSSEQDHWKRILKIADILQNTGLEIVISLHPLCKLETYTFLEERPKFAISRSTSIFELYPLSLFSVSFTCSTNFLADFFDVDLVLFDWKGMASPTGPSVIDHYIENAIHAGTLDKLEKVVAALAIRNVAKPRPSQLMPNFRPACPQIANELRNLVNPNATKTKHHKAL